jgi:hypothetical protein
MTRAQQTVSIGLLVTSVRKPSLSSKLTAMSPHATNADRTIVLPCSLPRTHSASKLDFGTDHSSCTLCLLLLKILLFLPTLLQRQTDRAPFLLSVLYLLKGYNPEHCSESPELPSPPSQKRSDRSNQFSPSFDLSASA